MTIFYEFQESQNNDDFWVLEILFSEICIWWLWIEMNVQVVVSWKQFQSLISNTASADDILCILNDHKKIE
jgi:hypothetical protein